MAKKVPCSGCGEMKWASKHKGAPAEHLCQACRRQRPPRPRSSCSIGGCDVLAQGEGLCWPHLKDARIARGDLCSEGGCGRPRMYKTLCATHGSALGRQATGRRYRYDERECGFCRSVFQTANRGTLFCSLSCAQRSRAGYSYSTEIVLWDPPVAKVKEPKAPRRSEWWDVLVSGPCHRCGVNFTARAATGGPVPAYCSDRCLKREMNSLRRVREREAFVAPVARHRIFERDGWRCQLCGDAVERDAVVPHPLAPTIDHVLPLAVGGKHEPANVQCAHFLCNSQKSDGLRLAG